MQQHIANLAHVQRAWATLAQQLRHLQIYAPERRDPRGGQQQPASAVAPGADKSRQAGHGAHGIAAAARSLHTVIEADGRRPGRSVIACQGLNLFHAQATDTGGALGRPLQCSGLECVPALGVLGDVVMVQPVVHDQLVHQRQSQCRIGAWQQLQVFLALVGGLALARVYADELGALALGFLRIAPEMKIAGNAVAAPDQYQLAFGKELHTHAQLAAIGSGQRLAAGTGADGAIQQAGAQLVKKTSVHALALHQSHGAGIAVWQYGFGRAPGNAVQALGNIAQRFVPAHRGEMAAAFGAAAFERLQHSPGVVGAFGVLADLGAEHAARVSVFCIALHLGGRAIDHRGEQGAGVRAVMRAGTAYLNDMRHVVGSKIWIGLRLRTVLWAYYAARIHVKKPEMQDPRSGPIQPVAMSSP